MAETNIVGTAITWLLGSRKRWYKPLEVATPLTPEVLDDYYKHVRDGLMGDMDFLRRPIRWRRFWSNSIKFIALITLAAGVLLPILQPGIGDFLFMKNRSGAEIALAAVAAGGLLLLFDRLFNVSGSWTRLMLAEIQVLKLLIGLQFEWAKRRPLITDATMGSDGVLLLDLLKMAELEAKAVMEAQKRSWATELDTAAAALNTRLEGQQTTLTALVQQQQQAQRPGAINIAIDKPGELEGPVQILIGGSPKGGSTTPQATYSVANVPPGLTAVKVTAKRKAAAGADFIFEKTIEVSPNAAASLTVVV